MRKIGKVFSFNIFITKSFSLLIASLFLIGVRVSPCFCQDTLRVPIEENTYKRLSVLEQGRYDRIPEFPSLDDALAYAKAQIDQGRFSNIESWLKELLEELVSPYLIDDAGLFMDHLEKMGFLDDEGVYDVKSFFEKICEGLDLLSQGGYSVVDLLKDLPGDNTKKKGLFTKFYNYKISGLNSVESIEKERRQLLQIAKDAYTFNNLYYSLAIYLMLGEEEQARDILAQMSSRDNDILRDENTEQLILPEVISAPIFTYWQDFRETYGYESANSYPLLLSFLAAYSLRDNYDIGIGVAKQGLFLSSIFSLMGLPVVIAEVHNHEEENIFEWKDEIARSMFEDKRIVIFENDVVTGRTLELAVKKIQEYNPDQIDVVFCAKNLLLSENIPRGFTNVYYIQDYLENKLLIPTIMEEVKTRFRSINARRSEGTDNISIILQSLRKGVYRANNVSI